MLVAVDGGDGAGKTRFADDLARHLEAVGRVAVRASADDFHHPREHRHALGRTAETVWARSFDYRALRRDLLDPWCGGPGSPYRRRHHDLATDTLLDEPPQRSPSTACSFWTASPPARRAPRLLGPRGLAEVDDEERVRRMAARDGVPADADHPDQRRYLDAQRFYRDAANPVGSADLVVDNADPSRPFVVGRPVVPPGWYRTPHGLRRVVTTDRETAERINRLLGGG